MNRITTIVTVLTVLGGLAGCGSDNAPSSTARSTTSERPTALSPSTVAKGCAPGIDAVATSKVPKDVASWSSNRPVIGRGALWTVRSASGVRAIHDQDIWRLKMPWFTRPFGIPRIDGRRLDGPGTFRADANQANDQNGTWVASTLEFSQPGCWEISARYSDSSVLRFRIRIGPA